jgi:hypothetical protein
MLGLGQHTSLGIVVGLLMHVRPQTTQFTGYCCWFMWGIGQHTLLGIVVGFVWGLGQHTLLGIIVWFTWASGNTHCWLMWGLGQHTLLGLMWAFSNGLKIIYFWRSRSVDIRIASETAEATEDGNILVLLNTGWYTNVEVNTKPQGRVS